MKQKGSMRLRHQLVIIGLLCCCVSLQSAYAAAACGPFLPSATNCPALPTPCQTEPPCDPVTGVFNTTCWVNKPDGAACDPSGAQPAPGATGYACLSGECLTVAIGTAADDNMLTVAGRGIGGRCPGRRRPDGGPCPRPSGCKAGFGGNPCKRCKKGTFSPGGSFAECQLCTSITQGFCRMAGGPCVKYPDCDRTTGEFIEKCWNIVAIDTPCHPDSTVNGDRSPLGNHVCKKDMDDVVRCMPKGPGGGGGRGPGRGRRPGGRRNR